MPKIILEFESEDELNQYILNKSMKLKDEIETITDIKKDVTISITTRKYKPWSEYEMNFILNNYAFKSSVWIAKALNRTRTQIMARVDKMRKMGANIPLKIHKNGKIIN